MGRVPTTDDFGNGTKVAIVEPPNNDPPTNVLILLHGLGDQHDSFTGLGRQMNLPETACVSIQAPQPLLDMGGFHWGDDIIFDSNSGGLDSDAGFKQTTQLLRAVVQDVLRAKCGFEWRQISLLGFGQGGMAALNLAVSLRQSVDNVPCELGGIISIGSGLPAEAPASISPKSTTPVLVCAGTGETAVSSSSEEKLQHVFGNVEIRRYRRPGDHMPKDREEMMPVMRFFSRRLLSSKGVPEGAVQISR